jgi:hypothetical protein
MPASPLKNEVHQNKKGGEYSFVQATDQPRRLCQGHQWMRSLQGSQGLPCKEVPTPPTTPCQNEGVQRSCPLENCAPLQDLCPKDWVVLRTHLSSTRIPEDGNSLQRIIWEWSGRMKSCCQPQKTKIHRIGPRIKGREDVGHSRHHVLCPNARGDGLH